MKVPLKTNKGKIEASNLKYKITSAKKRGKYLLNDSEIVRNGRITGNFSYDQERHLRLLGAFVLSDLLTTNMI